MWRSTTIKFELSLKNQNTELFPWDYLIGDKNYQKEPWILNKGKKYITIKKNIKNKGFFYLQNNDEKILSLSLLQIKSTYNQLLELGYELVVSN